MILNRLYRYSLSIIFYSKIYCYVTKKRSGIRGFLVPSVSIFVLPFAMTQDMVGFVESEI